MASRPVKPMPVAVRREAVPLGRLFYLSLLALGLAACGSEPSDNRPTPAGEEKTATASATAAASTPDYPPLAPGQIVTLESGLRIEVLTAGDGARPTPEDEVLVDYEGRLADGAVFDSSYSRGHPSRFPVGGVIAGWTEALLRMPVGSKWRLTIPPALAYGADGTGPIPPNATLVFDVDLIDIYKAPPANEKVAALIAAPVPASDCGAAPSYDPAATPKSQLAPLHRDGNAWQDCMQGYIKATVTAFSSKAEALRAIDPASVPPSQKRAVNDYFQAAMGEVAAAEQALNAYTGIPAR